MKKPILNSRWRQKGQTHRILKIVKVTRLCVEYLDFYVGVSKPIHRIASRIEWRLAIKNKELRRLT